MDATNGGRICGLGSIDDLVFCATDLHTMSESAPVRLHHSVKSLSYSITPVPQRSLKGLTNLLKNVNNEGKIFG